jgi:hypothetical protein
MTDFFAVSVDRASADELNKVQGVIKEHANGWWHRQTNFWIVGGQSASKWRDLIKPCLTETDSNVLVIGLPPADESTWAFAGHDATTKCKWLHDNY